MGHSVSKADDQQLGVMQCSSSASMICNQLRSVLLLKLRSRFHRSARRLSVHSHPHLPTYSSPNRAVIADQKDLTAVVRTPLFLARRALPRECPQNEREIDATMVARASCS